MDTNSRSAPNGRLLLSERSTKLISEVRRFILGSTPAEALIARELRQVLAAIERPNVTVTFGGHFKAGKSALLNALLERQILPVSDRPETGVACRIESGDADAGVVARSEGEFMIACTEQGVRRESRLIGSNGDQRTEIASIRQVRLTLKDAPIDRGITWIDPPGLNDVKEMDVRMREAAEQADILVWVMNSQVVLSEVEQAFLTDYAATHGAASMIFVLNVFLHGDPAVEWNRILINSSAALLDKVRRFARQIGGSHGSEPLVMIASAEGIRHDFDQYGGTQLRDLLRGSGKLDERVRQARHDRLALAIQHACDSIEPRASAHRTQLAAERQELSRLRDEAARRASDYGGAAQALLRGFVNLFTVEARRTIGTMTAGIRPGNVRVDGAYGRQLTLDFRTVVAQQFAALDQHLRTAARGARVPEPTAAVMQSVGQQFQVPEIGIPVPAITEGAGKGMMQGCLIAVGAFVLSIFSFNANEVGAGFFFLLGAFAAAFWGPVIGGFVGSSRKRDAEQKQVAEVCRAISWAAEAMIATFTKEEVSTLHLLVAAATETIADPPEDPVVTRILQVSERLSTLRTRADAPVEDAPPERDAATPPLLHPTEPLFTS